MEGEGGREEQRSSLGARDRARAQNWIIKGCKVGADRTDCPADRQGGTARSILGNRTAGGALTGP